MARSEKTQAMDELERLLNTDIPNAQLRMDTMVERAKELAAGMDAAWAETFLAAAESEKTFAEMQAEVDAL